MAPSNLSSNVYSLINLTVLTASLLECNSSWEFSFSLPFSPEHEISPVHPALGLSHLISFPPSKAKSEHRQNQKAQVCLWWQGGSSRQGGVGTSLWKARWPPGMQKHFWEREVPGSAREKSVTPRSEDSRRGPRPVAGKICAPLCQVLFMQEGKERDGLSLLRWQFGGFNPRHCISSSCAASSPCCPCLTPFLLFLMCGSAHPLVRIEIG